MARGMSYIEMLLFAGAIVFAIVMLGLILNLVFKVTHGACWGNVNTVMNNIKSSLGNLEVGGSETEEFTLGDCVDRIFVVNKESLTNFIDEVSGECASGFSSYMIAIPTVYEAERAKWYKPWTWGEKTEEWKDKIIKWIRQTKPICKAVDYQFGKDFELEGPERGSQKQYCVKLHRGTAHIYSVNTCGS